MVPRIMSEKPLITFAVVAFNQERYVREAVQAAFAQTYSPLEIILSDDRSTDSTGTILEEMAANYRGPHRVILNQNPANLGVGRHINRVVALAQGELLVGAAGDDVSLPHRTERIYQAWETSGRRPMELTSFAMKIDEAGREIGDLRTQLSEESRALPFRARNGSWNILGCTEAWHRKVFEVFGPLQDFVIAEDRAIEFRAMALGPLAVIEEPLVRYRIHGANLAGLPAQVTRAEWNRMRTKILRMDHAMFRQFQVDLDRIEALKLCPPEEIEQARRAIPQSLRNNELEQSFHHAPIPLQLALAANAFFTITPKTGVKWLLRALRLRRH
jgi:glycosyltransferase involved in cell wall biosynthesis